MWVCVNLNSLYKLFCKVQFLQDLYTDPPQRTSSKKSIAEMSVLKSKFSNIPEVSLATIKRTCKDLGWICIPDPLLSVTM